MPIPLIASGLVVAGGLVLGGAATIIALFAKKLSGKRVAILGRQQVGKTTLLHFLREGKVPEHSRNTVDPVEGGRFTMEVGREAVGFDVPKDLPGNDGLGYADWKEAFTGADYVWYLFRSDLIAQGNDDEAALVKGHLDMFKDWMDAGSSPKVILIGTWADQASEFHEDPERFKRVVGASAPIKLGAVKLSNAGLVVGGLNDNKHANTLMKSLGRRL